MFLWSCLFVSRETYSSGDRYDSRGHQQQDSGYSSCDSYRHGGRKDDARHDSAANQRRDNSTHAQSQQPGRDFRDRDERYDRRSDRSVPDRLERPFGLGRYFPQGNILVGCVPTAAVALDCRGGGIYPIPPILYTPRYPPPQGRA